MNEKEIAEIRRRYRPEKSNITSIRGCYVNEKREIVSEFNQSLAIMPEEESEKLLALLRRTLSGAHGKNLLDITFSTQQVVGSDEHRLLMALRDSALDDSDAVRRLFERVMQTVTVEGTYLIMLAYDKYDVPYRSSDGEKQDDASSDVFSYLLCSICPVKMTKPALSYYVHENAFHNLKPDWLVAPPELGFMFPAFDDRSTNLYNALFYTRDIGESHEAFVETIFHSEIPMPAAEQKEAFHSILGETLDEDCSYDVVQAVHEQLYAMIEEHKESKQPAPLAVSKQTLGRVLTTCGVADTRVAAFEEHYDAAFGADTDLSPRNIVDTKQFKVSMPDVTIQVNPERGDLLQTRIINGLKYILIRADEGVEVNGVTVHIKENEE